jgi:esterase
MQLFARTHGSGPPLVILHGLFGSSNNWNSLARKLGEHFTVFALDLRNHGHSPHDALHTYPAMADDVRQFLVGRNIRTTRLMGHSMGGKVAMELSLTHPEVVTSLVVVDIAPVAYPGSHDLLIDTLLALPSESYGSRAEADRELQKNIPDERVRSFLLTNLRRSADGTYVWGIPLDVLKAHRADLSAGLRGGRTFDGPALFVRGDRSDYVLPEYSSEILTLFPRGKITTVQGAGHWVHADAPEAFLGTVLPFLLGD